MEYTIGGARLSDTFSKPVSRTNPKTTFSSRKPGSPLKPSPRDYARARSRHESWITTSKQDTTKQRAIDPMEMSQLLHLLNHERLVPSNEHRTDPPPTR